MFETPDGLRLSHITLRDPTLPHQVVFQNPSGSNDIVVSCNCRQKYKTGVPGVVAYDPIGVANDIVEARILYNDPANHWTPFTEEYVAKW